MKAANQYDYIVTGAGCAGLSLLMHMIHSRQFANKRILLLDQDAKNKNDRTWCFWEKENSLFEPIIYKQWKQLWFHADGFSSLLHIDPYTYKLVRGIDFYEYCLDTIMRQKNIEFKQALVGEIASGDNETYVIAGGERYTAEYVFNSILFDKPSLKPHHYWLLQHFTGWVIETEQDVFDPSKANLMDFRTDQSKGTTFFYVLPFSENKALIEYTLFSKSLLSKSDYEQALTTYLDRNFHGAAYQIIEREFGVIPMTNFSFPVKQNNIINIGTAGGQTKGSSGYTFRFIQKNAQAIVKGMIEKKDPAAYLSLQKRFQFYDSVLLNILDGEKMPGDVIFTQLFKKNKATDVLSFLDNETSLPKEIDIIKSLPTGVFLKAAIQHLSKSF